MAQDFFSIPHMVISRDDLCSQFEDDPDKIKQIKDLSDEQMQEVANMMQKMIMDDYWIAARSAFDEVVGDGAI